MAFVMWANTTNAATSGYSASLRWAPSTDPAVVSYKVYYGTGSGNYTMSVPVGNSTSNTVTGLTPGTTYYFAVTAEDSTGLESAYSNEARYTPGVVSKATLAMSGPASVLSFRGQAGKTYEVSASQDLVNWAVIGTAIAPVTGDVLFTDLAAVNHPQRFYKMRGL